MTFHVSAVLVCCVIAAHVQGGESNKDSSEENIAKTDDANLPKIQIVVRTYAKAEVVENDVQKEDTEFGGNSIDVPDDTKSENHDRKLNGKDTELDGSVGDNQASVELHTNSDQENPNGASLFLTKSFERLSDMATLAWDYVTHADVQTPRPVPGNDLSGSAVIKEVQASLRTGVLDEGDASDVYFEEDQLTNTQEVSQESLPEDRVDHRDHKFLNDKTKIDEDSSETHSSTNSKANLPAKIIKAKPDRNKKNGKSENSKLKPFSNLHSRNKVKNSKVLKDTTQKIHAAGKNKPSSNYKINESGNDTHNNRNGVSNLTLNVENSDESSLFQDDEPSLFNLPKWWGSSETSGTPTKQPGIGPEDDEEDDQEEDDIGSASPVLGYDFDTPIIERPLVNNRQNSHNGILPKSVNPIAEADLSSFTVSSLINHFNKCDRCMTNINTQDQRCHYYLDQADEFDKWAKSYTDILRYGCPSSDSQRGHRCCHRPLNLTQTTLQEINLLIKSVSNTLWAQCNKCPVDCTWSEWQSWNHCPSICNGPASRNRTRIQRPEKYGGRSCPIDGIEIEQCTPELGTWLSWSPWSSCSSTCGGIRHRSRKCSQPTTSCFVPCDERRDLQMEVLECGNNTGCCHSRQWSQWSEWTDCYMVEAVMRVHRQRRWRSCEADPAYPGLPMCHQPCPGNESDVRDCCTPVSWNEWTSWSECLGAGIAVDLETRNSCGKGCRNRTRVCSPGTCQDKTCPGDDIERIFCNMGPCCVVPIWSQWCPWTECSVKCGPGTRRRSRVCQSDPNQWSSPTCRAGGCYGEPDTQEVEDCSRKCCDCVEPSWSEWGQWSGCDWNRINPSRSMRRRCIKSLDNSCGHLECRGESERSEPCECKRPYWDEWGQWSQCDPNSSPPVRQRQRVCRRPSTNPSYCHNENCQGHSEDRDVCKCERPYWDEWSQWSQCDQNSSPPVRQRQRVCRRPSTNPSYCHNENCQGHSEDRDICKCERPYWDEWSQWSQCDPNSSPPVRQRQRVCRRPSTNPSYCHNENCQGHSEDRGVCKCGRQEWGSWQEWSRCNDRTSVSTRTRHCSLPDPGCPNQSCPGSDKEMKACSCDPGFWGNWSPWSPCDCAKARNKSRTRSKHSLLIDRRLCQPLNDSQRTFCGDECPDCVDSCEGRENNEYPSCRRGCREFITCCQGEVKHDACKGLQQYDSLCRKCTKTPSPTCPDGQYDIYRKHLVIPEKTERCQNMDRQGQGRDVAT